VKVLYIGPCDQRYKTEYSIKKALERQGHEVHCFNDRKVRRLHWRKAQDRLLRVAERLLPDLVFLGKSSRVELQTLEELTHGRRALMWYFDIRVPPHKETVDRARLVDYFFVTNCGQLKTYRSLGVRRVYFLPQACDRDLHRPVKSHRRRWASDVAFIGTAYGEDERLVLMKEISRRFDLKIWGSRWEKWKDELPVQGKRVLGRNYARVCSAAKIIIGVNRYNSIDLCFSNRVWLTLGCGGFMLTHYVPGLEEIFENHKHLVWFKEVGECLDLIRYYLNHDLDRQRIAAEGYKFVHQYHTYDHRVEELLKIIGDEVASHYG